MISPPINGKYYTWEESLSLYRTKGLHKAVFTIYKNVLNQRGKISSADVSALYDAGYAASVESQRPVKTAAGFDINFYMQFAFDYIVRHGQHGSAVLDIGCGNGRLCFALSHQGFRVTGTDFDTSAIDLARARAVAVKPEFQPEFLNLPAGQIPGPYDFIILSDVAEHLSPSELETLLADVYRLLTPGGSVVLHTPNGKLHFWSRKRCRLFDVIHYLKHYRKISAEEMLRMKYLKEAYYDQVHINIMTPGELREALKKQGFCNIRTHCRKDVPLGLNHLGLSGSFGMTAIKQLSF